MGTGASFLVASNFPSNSVGSSIFSEGRSSIGMKSSVSLSKSNSGRITSFSFGVLVAETFWGVVLLVSSAVVAGCSSVLAAVLFFVPGLRPLFFGSDFSTASVTVFSWMGWAVSTVETASFSASSAMCAAVVGVAASSFCALSLVAVYTLSPSFLTLIRDLFLGWFSLRSSFTLAAATFLVAPTIACSSRIL